MKKHYILVGKWHELCKRAALLKNPVPDNLKHVIRVNEPNVTLVPLPDKLFQMKRK